MASSQNPSLFTQAIDILQKEERSLAELQLLSGLLKQVKHFKDTKDKDQVFLDVVSRLKLLVFSEGEDLFRLGDKPDFYYINLQGECGVYIKTQNEAEEAKEGMKYVVSLKEGTSFGQLSLLDKTPRKATVRCLSEKAYLGVIDSNDYKKLVS